MTVGVMDIVGWAAGALVLLTFYLRTMIPLRAVAIVSNVAFIAYGWMAGMTPILVLHACLLPLNAVRLLQMQTLIRKVRRASRGDVRTDWLVPHMALRRVTAGTTLFEKGDLAEEVFLILAGRVRIVSLNVSLGHGQFVGEMGMFAPENRRTATAVCETDVEIASIADDKIWELICQEPEFGASLLRVIVLRSIRTTEQQVALKAA